MKSSFLQQIEELDLRRVPPLRMPATVLEAAEYLGLTLRQTSPSAPEQYELVSNDSPSGYIRVRWSRMSVSYPDAGGTNLCDEPVGGFGAFTDSEREAKLLFALGLIATRMNKQ